MAHLAAGDDSVSMPLAADLDLFVARFPILFRSPVAYTDPQELDEAAIEAIVEDFGRHEDDEKDAFEDEKE
jgi:hypothetical protein